MRASPYLKPSPRPKRARLVIAVVVGAIAVIAVGSRLPLYLARFSPRAETEPLAVASVASGERSTTIIMSTPNSNDCRRYELNVTTGVRNEQGTSNCAGDGGKGPTRLEAISKSFRSH